MPLHFGTQGRDECPLNRLLKKVFFFSYALFHDIYPVDRSG